MDELQLTMEGHAYKMELEANHIRLLGAWIYGAAGSRQKPENMMPLPIVDAIKKEQLEQSHMAFIERAKAKGLI